MGEALEELVDEEPERVERWYEDGDEPSAEAPEQLVDEPGEEHESERVERWQRAAEDEWRSRELTDVKQEMEKFVCTVRLNSTGRLIQNLLLINRFCDPV